MADQKQAMYPPPAPAYNAPSAPPMPYGQAPADAKSSAVVQGQAPGFPPVTVQGRTDFKFDSSAPFYYPPDADWPVFLGATVGHDQLLLQCGKCGYQGPSQMRRKRGAGNIMAGIVTLGIGFLLPGLDTHHYCPQCNAHVAMAKPF